MSFKNQEHEPEGRMIEVPNSARRIYALPAQGEANVYEILFGDVETPSSGRTRFLFKTHDGDQVMTEEMLLLIVSDRIGQMPVSESAEHASQLLMARVAVNRALDLLREIR